MASTSLSLHAQAASGPSTEPNAPVRRISSIDAAHAHEIFKDVYNDVRKDYYDPTFHGVNLEQRYHDYDSHIDTAASNGDAFRFIAGFLMGLHDSHLFFEPPMRGAKYQVDYRIAMIGDRCFVTQVRPGTDAATKLHVGDEVLALNGFAVSRASLWGLEYMFHTLAPAPREQFLLRSPAGEKSTVVITHAMKANQRVYDLTTGDDFWTLVRQDEDDEDLIRERYIEHGNVMVWKMAEFNADINTVESMYGKARKHETLIIDLRGNPGGSGDTLELTLGHIFDRDLKIGDRIGRKPLKPFTVKAVRNPFQGKLIVLVDSESASSSEVFARMVQLEHRGTVLGDTSAGAVMEAEELPETIGTDNVIPYGMSVTVANLVMTDGKSLENHGVEPDEKILPTAADLAAGRDPVMMRAFELAGSSVPPDMSGKLFTYLWPKL
ncbi:MAG TPA: S41 family peptidase [Acidobacteriaceae bacterium]|nr:S41 family peptidase [Acidobacteriaceae bacterium]